MMILNEGVLPSLSAEKCHEVMLTSESQANYIVEKKILFRFNRYF